MHYIYYFDVAALPVYGVILYTIAIRRNLQLKRSRLFLAIAVCGLFSAIASLMGSLSRDQMNSLGISAFHALVSDYIFFFFHLTCVLIFTMYFIETLESRPSQKATWLSISIFYVLALILLATNPFTKKMFYMTEDGAYHRGSLIWLLYFCAFMYFGSTFFFTIKFRKTIRKDRYISLLSMQFLPLIANIIQYFVPELLLANFCLSLAILALYITLESPSEFMDNITGLQNADSFFIKFRVEAQRKKRMNIIVICIRNLEAWDKQIGDANTDRLLVLVGKFLTGLSPNITAYALERGEYALTIQSGFNYEIKQYSKFATEAITDRFEDPFEWGSYTIKFNQCTCLLSMPNDVRDVETMQDILQLVKVKAESDSIDSLNIEDLDINGIKRTKLIALKLETAKEDDSIIFHFLPVKNAATGKIDTLQSELDLSVTELGLVPAKEVLQIAQTNGTASLVSRLSLAKLLKFMSENDLTRYGIKTIEIIMSLPELLRADEAERLAKFVDYYHVPRSMIRFVIIKDMIISYEDMVTKSVRMMKEMGFSFVMENYGNGYTNEKALSNTPVDVVTIDRHLTAEAKMNPTADRMLRTSVKNLKELGFTVKAEHIENEEEERYALDIGCDLLQGYYYSKPIPMEELTGFLEGGDMNG